MMKDLKDLLKELVATKKRAGTDLEAVPYQTRASMTSMVQNAKEKLGSLEKDYFSRVRSNTLGMFLFGDAPRVVQFAEIAGAEAGVYLVQGDALYQRLADKIEPSLGNTREFGTTQLGFLIDELKLIQRKELGITRMQLPSLREAKAVKDRIELVAYIRKLVQGAVGDDLLRMSIDKRVNQLALDSEFTGKLLPVAVVGIDQLEVSALTPLFTNAVTVDVGTSDDGEVNKEYVLNQLSTFKKKIKSKTTSD
jgi:hypothetical protein